MHYPAPNIEQRLRGLLEPRAPLAATVVAAEAGHFVVLTLIPLVASRLWTRGRGGPWETRVYRSELPPRTGLQSKTQYAAFDESREAARSRHDTLIARLEIGRFEADTGREILALIHPHLDQAVGAFGAGDCTGAVAALDAAIRTAGRVDATYAFLHLYQEAFLLRGIALESIGLDRAKAAYRQFIDICAGLDARNAETIRAIAWARQAAERLTPTP